MACSFCPFGVWGVIVRAFVIFCVAVVLGLLITSTAAWASLQVRDDLALYIARTSHSKADCPVRK